jgi:hypothetical protein
MKKIFDLRITRFIGCTTNCPASKISIFTRPSDSMKGKYKIEILENPIQGI